MNILDSILSSINKKTLPIRKPQLGDIVTYMNENAYKGMCGIVDYVSNDDKSFSINTQTSILIIPEITNCIYMLHSNDKTYQIK